MMKPILNQQQILLSFVLKVVDLWVVGKFEVGYVRKSNRNAELYDDNYCSRFKHNLNYDQNLLSDVLSRGL